MIRVIISIVLTLSLSQQSLAKSLENSDDLQITSSDQLVVEGPVKLVLNLAEQSSLISASAEFSTSKLGNVVTLTADQPCEIHLAIPGLASIQATSGQVYIKVSGNERMYLSEVSAPEVHLQLLGRSRFDADNVTTEHLMVTLSEQGKASLDHVEAELLELAITDHGDMDVAGKTKRQQVELSGFSHYDAEDLESDEAMVALSDYSAGSIQAKTAPLVTASPYAALSAR